MPVMEPDLDAATLKAWARAIDDGPFSSLCWGERIAFDNPEAVTLLGALAAWTDRVRLVTTVLVPQLHDAVLLAKSLATGDMLSGGRLTVGVGVGGRSEDYRAVGADPATQTMRGMAERVEVMKRVWAGEKVDGFGRPGRARPAATGRPATTGRHHGAEDGAQRRRMGRRACGHHAGPRPRQAERVVRRCAHGMGAGGQAQTPLATSFWFALGDTDDARAQIHRHLRRYMNWIPAEYVDAMAPGTGWAGSEDELLGLFRKFEDIGTDEIHLIPTSSDADQVRRVADVVKDFG